MHCVHAGGWACRTIDGNNLSGSIPSSWGEGLPSLNRAIVQPGNEGLCTQAPAGAAFQLCSDYDQWCQNPLTSSCSPSCSMGTPGGGASSSSGGEDSGSDASPSGGGSDSSSVPLAAIVAPIAVVAAASLAALAFVLLQRSRQRSRQEGQALGKAPGSLLGGSGSGFKPDIAFPPSELAFHEVRYACTVRPALDVLLSGLQAALLQTLAHAVRRAAAGLQTPLALAPARVHALQLHPFCCLLPSRALK